MIFQEPDLHRSRIQLSSGAFRIEIRVFSRHSPAHRRAVLLGILRALKPLFSFKSGELIHSEHGPKETRIWPRFPLSFRRSSNIQTKAGQLGMMIRLQRLGSGFTQAELARAAGLDVARLSVIETGKAQPRVSTLRKIEAALGCRFETQSERKVGRSRADSARTLDGAPQQSLKEANEAERRSWLPEWRPLK